MEKVFIINFKERINNYDAYSYNLALTFLVFHNFVNTILNLGYTEKFNEKDIYVNNLKCDIKEYFPNGDFYDYFKENINNKNIIVIKNIDLEDIDKFCNELDFINDNLQDFYSILENTLCYRLLKANKIYINCFCNSNSSIISIQGLK